MKKADINNFEKDLEDSAGLVTEAVHDVILITILNDEKTAFELIKKQFLVINRQDIDELKD